MFSVVVVLVIGAVVIATVYGLLTLGYRFGEEAGYEKGLLDGETTERRKMLRLVEREKRR